MPYSGRRRAGPRRRAVRPSPIASAEGRPESSAAQRAPEPVAGSRRPRLHSCWPCCRSLRSGRVEEGIVPTPEARHRMVDSFTLQYYYEGFSVAYRPTPQGWKFWLWVLRRLARPCARAPSPTPLRRQPPSPPAATFRATPPSDIEPVMERLSLPRQPSALRP